MKTLTQPHRDCTCTEREVYLTHAKNVAHIAATAGTKAEYNWRVDAYLESVGVGK
jgi:hypothetical protein